MSKKTTTSISYSSAQKYKTCPEKYFLSKKYKTKLSASALPFGKAVEAGIEALFKGVKLEDALDIFRTNWFTEAESKYDKAKQIFDNNTIQFYFSDYDKNVFNAEDEALMAEWIAECELDSSKDWQTLFDDLASRYKDESNSLKPNELRFYNRVLWLSCEIRGQIMLKAFYEKLLPKLTLLEVDGKPASQIPIVLKNEDGDTIPGYIDFLVKHEDYEEPIVVDVKTSAFFYSEHTLDTSDQLRTYIAAKGLEFNTKRGGYIVLIKKLFSKKRCDTCGHFQDGMKKNCAMPNCKGKYSISEVDANVQFISKEFKDDQLEDVLNDYMNVATAMKNEIRFKNSSNCMQYNKPCEFYDVCWKRKAAEELEHLELKKQLTTTDESDTTD